MTQQSFQHPQQMQQQQMQPTSDSRLSALETRVEGIVGTLQSVASAVTGLSDKLDRRGQTPWGVIWSAVGVGITVLTVVGGLAFWPLTSGMSDLKTALQVMQDRADKRTEQVAATQVTRAEHELHWRAQERDYDFQRDRIARVEARAEKRNDQLAADLKRLEDNVVSRSELTGRFEAQDRVVGMLRGSVDEHIRAFNDRQQHRIDALDTGRGQPPG
ncbi:hypothetical protein [Methylobacterium haplocladii]|uniref:Uncharacterized protein n=2 Tax=Methylobacterium haplocladii TaxID=1176176 RepID=A0A512ISF2_9HYPH|nr:hypothetical protein [Methylobacterium haplocladii]GEP00606.1 hypothetical protein MHA02_29930 [Methylobacterium haplocladii]GJD85520.1 hypothetical protein HPGCJGGD_3409 [Methylobacterium haplocladii]GLS57754.1 hypothetical protein GCM10007887_04100 [Methylobacterium haplocladii]